MKPIQVYNIAAPMTQSWRYLGASGTFLSMHKLCNFAQTLAISDHLVLQQIKGLQKIPHRFSNIPKDLSITCLLTDKQ